MGTTAHILVVDTDPAFLDHAQSRIEELERRWSRFLPTSEVSALNRNAGRALQVSNDTIQLVRRALEARDATHGLFDPTVLGDVVRAGYDRSFDALGPVRRAVTSDLTTNADGIEIEDNRVRLPSKTGFDPGGIGKGLAADFVTEELVARGAAGVCVNLGGDIRVAGVAPGGGAWTIDVVHPELDEPVARVGVTDGAVATSTTLRRRWTVDAQVRHHLIDPRTGRPSATRNVFATVIAGYAWAADVLAKVLVLDTGADPFAALRLTGAEALVVDTEHHVSVTFGLAAFTRRAA